MRVKFLRPAEDEYLAALRYYASQSVDLGAAFLDDLVDKRQVLLRRFHHSAVYELTSDEVVVVAVPHHRQRPKSWRERN